MGEFKCKMKVSVGREIEDKVRVLTRLFKEIKLGMEHSGEAINL